MINNSEFVELSSTHKAEQVRFMAVMKCPKVFRTTSWPIQMKHSFCVYILFSLKDKLLYIGYTTDLKKRLQAHEKGYSEATAPRRPLKLIFCEYYLSMSDAKRREAYFKTTAGKKALKLMLRDTLSEIKQ